MNDPRPAYIDISPQLNADLPVWPGDTPFRLAANWQIDDTCPVNVAKLSLSTHSGAHADAPLHYDPDGKAIHQVDLSAYMGPCRVIDLHRGTGVVSIAEASQHLGEGTVERLLIRTLTNATPPVWPDDFRPIAPDFIESLFKRGCRLIGTDAPSLDAEESKSLAAHMAVKETGMAILEGLVLDHVTPGNYELIALPLNITGADASPVRAILRL